MKTIRRFSVSSVFKVAAVVYGLMFAIFGCFVIILPGLLGSSLLGDLAQDSGLAAFGSGIVVTILSYIVGIVVSAMVSGIFVAIGAIIYNVVAGWVGGIQVEVE